MVHSIRIETSGTIISNLNNISQQCGNRCTDTAITIRDQFCTFFKTVGVIPWQDTYVREGQY